MPDQIVPPVSDSVQGVFTTGHDLSDDRQHHGRAVIRLLDDGLPGKLLGFGQVHGIAQPDAFGFGCLHRCPGPLTYYQLVSANDFDIKLVMIVV